MEIIATLIIFALLAYGWTNIMVFGSIFDGWRDFWNRINPSFFGKLFSCPMCLSTWVGFFLSALFLFNGWPTPMESFGIDNTFYTVFLDGVLTSGVVWIIHSVVEWFEVNRPQ